VETGATGELVRHRQTKGAATDMSGLKPPAPHSDSTDTVEKLLAGERGGESFSIVPASDAREKAV
jgi:hypothetical protein